MINITTVLHIVFFFDQGPEGEKELIIDTLTNLSGSQILNIALNITAMASHLFKLFLNVLSASSYIYVLPLTSQSWLVDLKSKRKLKRDYSYQAS